MKKETIKKLAAAVLSVQLVMQAGALGMTAFATDPAAPALSDVTTDSTSDAITLTNAPTIPDSLKKGGVVTVRGTVASDSSNLTSVTAGVYNASGQFVTGKTVNPGAKSYDLRTLDRYITFNTLADGEYTFAIIASNSSKTNLSLMSKKFTVGNAAQTAPASEEVKLTGDTKIPANLKKGQAVTVRGTVTANADITNVSVSILDSSNNSVTGGSASPNAKTYDLRNLDNLVSFNKLAEGSYTYTVTARVGGGLVTLSDQKFTVGNAAAAQASNPDDALTISGGTNMPATLKAGGAVNVTGIVTSADSNMTSLTVGVYDSAGNLVTGKTVNPASKTYDLKNLDSYVAFHKLSGGNYTYAVIASNAANTNYALVSKSFTVSGSSSSNTSGSGGLSISGGTTIPSTITPGKIINITGIVTSDSTMTALTCGVYSASGKFVTGRTINPKSSSYDLKKFDSYVAFNNLPAGNYAYAVIASNASAKNFTLVNKKFTVSGSAGSSSASSGDDISISGSTTVPASINKGKGMLVRGTVSSASSNLSSVTVGVYDVNGALVTGKTVNPGAKSYNVNALDSSVRFNDLSAGTYYYRVIASNGANSNYTIVNQRFSVQ